MIRGSVAKQVRERKALHPELYCRNPRCLHRAPCPTHEAELEPTPAVFACDDPEARWIADMEEEST